MRIFSERFSYYPRSAGGAELVLKGPRVTLRPLREKDYKAWKEVRSRCHEWLVRWEPRLPDAPYPGTSPSDFRAKLHAQERDRELGTGYSFGIFVGERFAGEISLGAVQRGASQSAAIGYWIDKELAGNGYVPEAVVVALDFAFRRLYLHRIEVNIVPRNRASLRVAEKLGLRREGVTADYLLIDGKWEDHVRFGMTAPEYEARRAELRRQFGFPES
jgi:ribosomal-protein-alanine N-acetyltransferase